MKYLLCVFMAFCFLGLQGQVTWIDDEYYFTFSNIYPNSPEETIQFVLPTSDGGYLLVGHHLYEPGDIDGLIMKVDSEGIFEWGELTDQIGNDSFTSAVELNGFYYVTGYSNDNNSDPNVWVFKINTDGSTLDSEIYDDELGEATGRTIETTFGGNIIIGGTLNPSAGKTGSDGFIQEINPNNLQLIPTSLRSGLGFTVSKIEQTTNDSYWVFGEIFHQFEENCCCFIAATLQDSTNESSSAGFGGSTDVFVKKFSSSLNQTNHFDIGGFTDDHIVDGITTNDGGFAILGSTECSSTSGGFSGPNDICDQGGGFTPFWIYNSTSQGSYEWVHQIDGNPFGIINSCDNQDILFASTNQGFPGQYYLSIHTVSQFSTPQQLQSSPFITSSISGRDLKRGLNNDITIGGKVFNSEENNEDLALFRFTGESSCSTPCPGSIQLSCGIPFFGTTTDASNNYNNSDYSCYPGSNSYNAGDQVFSINKSEPGDLAITLFSNNINHDIFLLSECSSGIFERSVSCYNDNSYSARSIGSPSGLNYEVILIRDAPLGVYYVVVDGANTFDEGDFTLTATCGQLDCSLSETITCGVPKLSQSNFLISNNVSHYCTSSIPVNGGGNTGGERVYSFSLSSSEDISISLHPHESNDDFDLYLLNSCDDEDCQDSSTNPTGEDESIETTLSAGTYYIVVDGWRETQGFYDLYLNCCPAPEFDYSCNSINYSHNNNLNYTFSAESLNDYASDENWLINNASVSSSLQGATYSFPGDGTYNVCAPYYNEDGCVDYCCTTYCIRVLPDCLEGLIPPCEEDCSCVESFSGNLPLPFQCETFSSYTTNTAVTSQSNQWSLEAGQANAIVGQDGEVNTILYLAPSEGTNPGVLYHLKDGNGDNLGCGRYRVSWQMQVNTNNSAGFRILYDQNTAVNPANIPLEVSLLSNGSAFVKTWDENNNQSVNTPFYYAQSTWIKPMFIIDLEENQLEFWLNSRLIHVSDYNYNLAGNFGSGTLGAITFFGDQNAEYLIDNICVRAAETSNCSTDIDQVCVQNGNQYDNSCIAAQSGLYTGDELEVCLSVCDFGGEFIGRNDQQLILNSLETYEQAPNLAYSNPDVIDDFDGAFPLYTDLYVFENEENGIINIDFNGGSNNIAYVYRCTENGSEYINPATEIRDDPQAAGFYYILVVSQSPVIEYGITIFPSSPCTIQSETLTCGSSINSDFSGSFFGYQHENSIDGCYNGSNAYDSEGKVYRLEIDQASVIDIELNATGGAAAIFLYGSNCGNTCLDYAETSFNGGLATIENATLADGYYYLVVFEKNPSSSVSFSIDISCIEDTNNSTLTVFSIDGNCEQDFGSVHTVGIDFGSINNPTLAPGDQFSIQIKPAIENSVSGNPYISDINLTYLQGEDEGTFPLLPLYTGLDIENRCAFLPGDTITLAYDPVAEESDASVCTAIFRSSSTTPGIDAEDIFNPGSQSEIIDYTIDSTITLTLYPSTFISVPSEAVNSLLNVYTNNLQWTPISTESWITFEQQAPFNNNSSLIIQIAENESFEERIGQIIIQTTEYPIVSKTITIRQDAPCIIPVVNFPGIANQTINICEGESVTITAETTTAPSSIYQFFWNGEETEEGNTKTISSLGVDTHNYPLTVQQRGCPSALIETTITIIVSPNPEPIELNRTHLNSCSDETAFMILDPEDDVTYVWQNAAGDEYNGSSFTPPNQGNYSVYSFNTNNDECTSDPINISYSEIETLVASDATTNNDVCLGDEITLSVSTNFPTDNLNFDWDHNITQNTASVSFVPQEPGLDTIDVEIQNGNCPSQFVEIPIHVIAVPQTPNVADVAYCDDDVEVIPLEVTNSSGDQTVNWYTTENGGTPTSENPYTPGYSGTFWVEIADGGCFSERTSVENTIDESFTLNLMGDEEICVGNSSVISANTSIAPNNLNFDWSNNINGSGEDVSFFGTNEGSYSVDLTASNGTCVETASLNIDVGAFNVPDPIIDMPDINLCPGDPLPPSLLVSTTDPDRYTVYWYDSPSTDANPIAMGLEFLNPTVGTYYVETVDINVNICTSDRLPISISQTPEITSSISIMDTPELIACEGSEVILLTSAEGGSGSNNLRYRWNDGLSQGAILSINIEPGFQTHVVTITDINNNCQEVDSITIEGIPLPTYAVISDPICINDGTQYTITINTNADNDQVSMSSPGSVSITPLGNGDYQFIVQAETNFDIMIGSGEGDIICDPLIKPILAPDCSCPTIAQAIPMAETVNICINDSEDGLLEVEDPGENLIIKWYDNSELAGDSLGQGTIFETAEAGTYYAIVEDPTNNNCRSSFPTPITLVVNDLPIVDAGDDEVVCFGDLVQLDASEGSSGALPLTYQWTPNTFLSEDNIASPILTANEEMTSLVLIVTDNNDCSHFDQLQIQTTSLPEAGITVLQDILCFGDLGELEATYSGEHPLSTLSWSTSSSETTIDQLPPNLYTLTVIDENGCEDEESVLLNEPTPLMALDITNDSIVQDGQTIITPGILGIVPSGGTPPYTYTWLDEDDNIVSNNAIYQSTQGGAYYLTVIDQNNCTFNYTYMLGVITSLSDITDIGTLNLFPNPTYQSVMLEVDLFSSTDMELILLDGLGQRIKTAAHPNVRQDRFDLDMHNLPAGVYWLQIKIGATIINKKIIKID